MAKLNGNGIEVTCPIYKIYDDPNLTGQTEGTVSNNAAKSPQLNPGQAIQSPGNLVVDPQARMDAQFSYYMKKAQFDLNMQGLQYEQRLAYENNRAQMLFNLKEYQRRIGSVVFTDQNGITCYGLVSPEYTGNGTGKGNSIIQCTRLLNVLNYHTRRLVSYPPAKDSKAVEILEISWSSDASREGRIYWKLGGKSDSAKTFSRKLRAKGVFLLVSGRTTNQAADALLAFSYSSAEEVEIPFHYGWNYTKDEWVFAEGGVLTMEDIMKCLE